MSAPQTKKKKKRALYCDGNSLKFFGFPASEQSISQALYVPRSRDCQYTALSPKLTFYKQGLYEGKQSKDSLQAKTRNTVNLNSSSKRRSDRSQPRKAKRSVVV